MQKAKVNGVELSYESFGHPTDPPILLIGPSRLPDAAFCRAVAEGGRFVIRYAERMAAGDPPRSGAAQVEDAVALLAELDHSFAHLVGIGTDGIELARQLASRHPERVRSLTELAEPSAFARSNQPSPAGPESAEREVVRAILRRTSGGWDAEAGRLARRGAEAGHPPTAWFDELYRAGDEGRIDMPWDRDAPNPVLAEWLAGEQGRGRTAAVVGAGLGADAEFLAGLGWDTLAFDVSAHAIRLAELRHPGTRVKYRAASLFELPAGWHQAFELVVEIFTVQALPRDVREAATAAVASLVAPGGRLLVVSGIHGEWPVAEDSPPWPLTAAELHAFTEHGLVEVSAERVGSVGSRRWRAEFTRRGTSAGGPAR